MNNLIHFIINKTIKLAETFTDCFYTNLLILIKYGCIYMYSHYTKECTMSLSPRHCVIYYHIAANISKIQLVMKPTKTNCTLVFEAILLKDFSLLIARLHSGGCHDETIGSSLVPVYYPLLHRTNWYADKQGINTMLIGIHNTFR